MRYIYFYLMFFSFAIFANPINIGELLEAVRTKNKLPAIAAAVVKNDKIIAIGATGFRKHGSDVRVTISDKFHIGSCTKSMTATLVAMMVEQKKVNWNITVSEAFPQFKIHPVYQKVTLEQLLGNRGGVPPEPNRKQMVTILKNKTIAKQRLDLVAQITKNPPAQAPGTYTYSNCSFIIAGTILEAKLKNSWESLLKKHLLKPLKMTSAGFGPPDSGKIEHPWGHFYNKDQIIPINPNVKYQIPSEKYPADNPAFYGPCGTVHCTIKDLATYVIFHLQGMKGTAKNLSKASFSKLHMPPKGHDYALGWLLNKGEVWHNGSNTSNFTLMVLLPKKDFAVVISTNIGRSRGRIACDRAATILIRKFLQK